MNLSKLVMAEINLPIGDWLWPNIPSLLISLATLLMLFLIFKFFLFDKVRKMVETRQNFIESQIETAKLKNAEAEELRVKSSQSILEAHKQAAQIISDATSKASKEQDKIISKAKEEATRLTLENREQILNEKAQMQSEIQKQIIEVAMQAAQKVVEREVTFKDNERLVNDFVSGVKN